MKTSPVEMMPSATTPKEWPGTGREVKVLAVLKLTSCEFAQAALEFEARSAFGRLLSWGAIKTFSIFR